MFKEIDWKQNHTIGLIVLVVMAAIMPFTPAGNGWDYFKYYQPDALSGTFGEGSWLPYYGYWLILPFAWLPDQVGYVGWVLLNTLGFIIACRYWNTNPLALALSIPLIFSFSQGQIEGVIALGVSLSLAANPVLAGLGLVILSIKPQISLLIGFHVLLMRFHWKLFIMPAIIFGLSLLQWGWWVDDWLLTLDDAGEAIIYSTRNVSLWPWALALVPLVWIYRERPKILLWLTTLMVPYYAFYSYAVPFSAGITVPANIITWLLTLVMIVTGIFFQTAYLPPWWIIPAVMIYAEIKASKT